MDILVKCEKLDHFGRGMCRYDGKIIFVPGLLPSEEAFIKIVSSKKKFSIGEIVMLKSKSLKRVCAKCVYENCGCGVNNLDYSDTLLYKKEKVADILKRFGGFEYNDLPIVPSDSIYNYRNKITLKVKDGKLGYFKNGTNDLIEIDKCLIASAKMNEIIEILNGEDLSNVSEVVIKDMGEVMIIIKGEIDFSPLKELADSIYVNDKLVYGNDRIISKLGNYKFYVSKDSFFQVNSDVALKMYNKILEYIGYGDSVIDLYCGTGTISLFLSNNFNHVTGIEINKEATECANDNLKLNNVSNVSFKCGDANTLVKGMRALALVVDPARAGLMKEGIKNIIDIRPNRMVYVSCDPVTLARDLKLLSEYYDVCDITLFDMFPWTYHVETVCLLKLK